MLVKISEKGISSVESDVSVTVCETQLADSGETEFYSSGNGYRFNLGICRPADGECGEEEILQLRLSEILKFCLEHKAEKLAVDMVGFYALSYNFSYIFNLCIDLIAYNKEFYPLYGDNCFRITFCGIEFDPDCTDQFEDYLSRPQLTTVNQVYGNSDNIQDKFDKFIRQNGEMPFREYLLQLINRKKIKKFSDVYKAAGISKFTFSKIMNFKANPPHRPSKETVAALAIGLKLDIDEAEKLYNAAGYHLGMSDFIDKVINFFIKEKIYDMDAVNLFLYYYGYPPLGERPRGGKLDLIKD